MSARSTKTPLRILLATALWLATLGAAFAQESPAKITFNLDRADVAVLAKALDEAAKIHDAVRLAQICRTGASP
jgi:hypothetical protein